MVKVAIVTLGCPKNRVDSESLLGGLEKEGFRLSTEPEEADLIFVNTCGFIEEAKKESIEEILKLKEMKEKGKKLFVFGCLAQRYREDILREIPEIDGLWGVGEDEKIIEHCKEIRARGYRQEAIEKKIPESGDGRAAMARKDMPLTDGLSPMASSSYAYLKIADGCDRGCAFCVIPSIRGPFRSGDPDGILRRAEEHIAAGVKELIVIAQDIGSYGKDLKAFGLPSLLRDLTSLSGDFRIRLLYLYPTAVTDELLSVVKSERKICKYLDIPLQHSEDRMLRAMGRGGTRDWYRKEMKKIREAIPDVTLRTTFIVGFPGESEEDFEGLKEFVEETRFERLGVFTYSKEEGTAAAKMKGHVPKKIKEKRRDEVMRLQSLISLEKNEALVGRRFRALVDEVDGKVSISRLHSQAPEIDGVVIIEEEHGALRRAREKKESENSSLITHHSSRSLRVGDFVTVEIASAYDYDLKGVLIPDEKSEIKKHKSPIK